MSPREKQNQTCYPEIKEIYVIFTFTTSILNIDLPEKQSEMSMLNLSASNPVFGSKGECMWEKLH